MTPIQKNRLLFIVNPISGGSSKKINTEELILKNIDQNIYEVKIITTKFAGEASQIAQKYRDLNWEFIVAVGGDGTINEVAKELVHSNTAFGIIPKGSGNGFARHLGINMNMEKAIKQINQANVTLIDTGVINDKAFFCTSGVGFDAHIGWEFSQAEERGFHTYLKKTISEFKNYKPSNYKIKIDGKYIERNALLVTIANASQYGNNAYIAPDASITDGLLDLVVFHPFSFFKGPKVGYDLLRKKLPKSKFVEYFKGKEIQISREEPAHAHYDGEPILMHKEINAKIIPASLKVLVPQKSKLIKI